MSRTVPGSYTWGAPEPRRTMPLALLILFILAAAAPAADAIVPLTEAPDESGGIPILMYHHVSAALDTVYNVPPAVFYNQLLQLYEAGFVLISLSDYYEDAFRVPAGRKPLVLTFDDGFPDNFRLLPDGSIDPDCAVGVTLAFAREHPDFGRTAVFFLNAGVWAVPFGDAATAGDKLLWLVENGYEVGNHTTDHVNLRRCDSFQVRRQIGLCQAALYDSCPELEGRVRFFAYPYGAIPKDPESFKAVEAGGFDGVDYRMDLAFLTWDNLAPSPADPTFRQQYLSMPRIEMHTREGGNGHTPRWLANHENLYVSDGAPGSLPPTDTDD